jgi:cytochrome c peroxidase
MITNSALAALKCAVVLCLFSQWCWADTGGEIENSKNEPIFPIPPNGALDYARLELGSVLYNDKRLSRDGEFSCASCHQLDHGGSDGRVVGLGTKESDALNTPSIFNAKFNFRQNWDGSAQSLAEQLDMTVRQYGNKDHAWDELLARLNKDTELVKRFARIYRKTQITRADFTDAMVYYVNSLTTPNCRFDQYLQGDRNAIDEDELRGYTLFKDYGCVSCHQGVNIGGNLYQRFGIFYDYFRARGNIKKADYGRINVTGRSTDMHVFKVPSLRNVALTAPYLHDGQVKTLGRAVSLMGTTQLGVDIKKKDIALIVKFLKTLTGDTSGFVREEHK